MESQTYIKNVKLTPKKLRLLLPAVKRLAPAAALDYLLYTQNKGAMIFYKAIKSALTNAKVTLKVDDESLKFKTFLIEEGQKLKRFRAGGRGTARPYKRRFSHIKIILEAKKGAKALKPEPIAPAKVETPKAKIQVKSKTKK